MEMINHHTSRSKQLLLSFSTIIAVSLLGYTISGLVGYRVVAFLLLVAVSVLSMFLGIRAVMLAALLSALIWDFFFIPPRFTFHVDKTEDMLLLLMYFVIALINAVLINRIRKAEQKARDKEEQEKSLKLYNTILNSLSHELRTPISTIIAATDNLQNEQKLTESDKTELVAQISTASLRLNQQVENLLNISRLESGFIKPKKDWSDVSELIYTVLHKLEPYLAGHKVHVSIPDNLPLFKIDTGLTVEILYNLIYNASVHTHVGTVVNVSVACLNENCVIVVSDNGIGFPDDMLEKVFEKFYRIDNAKAGGTGLGLSIVKGFTEAQGGTIVLRNNASGGAEFTLTLPAEISYINSLKNE
jgi:two-component system, OmpR family, sensor histidine kinase KdpD